jgi:hypothetical protein
MSKRNFLIQNFCEALNEGSERNESFSKKNAGEVSVLPE